MVEPDQEWPRTVEHHKIRGRATSRDRCSVQRRLRPLSGPQDTQDDDSSLVIKDEVDHHSLVVLAEEVRTHVPIGSLTVVSLTTPWCDFQDGYHTRNGRHIVGPSSFRGRVTPRLDVAAGDEQGRGG